MQEIKQIEVAGALRRALHFLEGAQTRDGRWLDFRFSFLVGQRDMLSSHWVTAYVGTALARAGGSEEALMRARQWLQEHPHPEGGWGFNLATPADADSTNNVVAFLSRWREETEGERQLERACRELMSYWEEREGGFRTYRPQEKPTMVWTNFPGSGWCDVHLCVTAMAACSLYMAGEERHRPILQASAQLLRRHQSAEGYWEAYWWHGHTYVTYHAAWLLHALGEAPEQVARAVGWAARQQGEDGGWSNGTGGQAAAFHTALGLSTLLLEEHYRQDPAVHAGLAWLLRHQQEDGSWPNVPIMRIPRPDVHKPWEDPDGCLVVPLVTDRNRLFTTATVVSALVDYLRPLGGLTQG